MAEWPYNTARWLKLRAAHLAIEPLCRGCKAMGRLTGANTVDHVHAINEGGPAFPGHNGLASYCTGCHSSKTARGAEAGAIHSNKTRKGCDINGSPLAPDHPWNLKGDHEFPTHSSTLARISGDDHRSAYSRGEPRPLHSLCRRATLDDGNFRTTQTVGTEAEKSLIAGGLGARGDHKNQLVSKGNRNGR